MLDKLLGKQINDTNLKLSMYPGIKYRVVTFAIIILPVPQESHFFLHKGSESISIFLLPLPEFRHHLLGVRLLQEPFYYSLYMQFPSSPNHLSNGYQTRYPKICLLPWLTIRVNAFSHMMWLSSIYTDCYKMNTLFEPN